MRREFRFAVLGLGGIGSAAACRLAMRAPGEVLGLERYELGHLRGASEDHSRIIRRSYHTEGYVRLTEHAYRAWDEIEAATGETLVVRTGGLDLWPPEAAIPAGDYTGSMRAADVPFEELDAAEVMRRWPAWKLDPRTTAVFQEDAGLVVASRANVAHRRLAEEHGAVLLEHSPVTAVRDAGGEVEVEAAGERFRVGALVVAADGWTNDVLAMLGVRPLPLTLTKEHVVYMGPEAPSFQPDRFPVWIWMDDPSFYGVPAMDRLGPKVAQDVGGREIRHPDARGRADPEALGPALGFASERLPAASREKVQIRPCTYTLTPDRDFVLDRVPGHPEILLALGAAHGFKFSAWFGVALADLAIDGRTDADLSPFSIDRPVLRMDDPPQRFLI